MTHLYLLDDDVNSFKYVYTALMEHAEHLPIQAEQCCLLAHETGKCHIKQGDFMDMYKLKKKLENLDIQIQIQDERNE